MSSSVGTAVGDPVRGSRPVRGDGEKARVNENMDRAFLFKAPLTPEYGKSNVFSASQWQFLFCLVSGSLWYSPQR